MLLLLGRALFVLWTLWFLMGIAVTLWRGAWLDLAFCVIMLLVGVWFADRRQVINLSWRPGGQA
jgi:hypothetical protein